MSIIIQRHGGTAGVTGAAQRPNRTRSAGGWMMRNSRGPDSSGNVYLPLPLAVYFKAKSLAGRAGRRAPKECRERSDLC